MRICARPEARSIRTQDERTGIAAGTLPFADSFLRNGDASRTFGRSAFIETTKVVARPKSLGARLQTGAGVAPGAPMFMAFSGPPNRAISAA